MDTPIWAPELFRNSKQVIDTDIGRGAGSALNPSILISAGVATFIATAVSVNSIVLQLKNYRKPILQRMTVRIMVMIPLYAISSLISLFSLDAAFAIDAIRDVYEAFVIYAFFQLMINYLGGERSLLIMLYGRPPKRHIFPVSLFVQELDASDPFTFLFLKRGILQYVQVKPILAAVTLLLKATSTYKEGKLSWSSGYLYISFIYNASICLSLYCLAMFWVCVNADIKPFRPMPKFLCIKGILFFSFWQALGISALVAIGAIKSVGPYTDAEHISLAITDTLICFEMPFFALAHWFAFSHMDYIDKHLMYAARMPFYYAFRDAFGFLDVLEDSRATLRGGVSYQTFEPVEGGMHQGIGRDRRIRAGLRYVRGGQKKYWIPKPAENADQRSGETHPTRATMEGDNYGRFSYSQLPGEEVDEQLHDGQRLPLGSDYNDIDGDADVEDEWVRQLQFGEPDPDIEKLIEESRKLVFGDYNYPCIDVSGEEARRRMWDEEERILKDQRAAFSPSRDASQFLLGRSTSALGKYGATSRSDLRLHSEPAYHAARSALNWHKGKDTDPSQRPGLYGTLADNAHLSPSNSSQIGSDPIVPKAGEPIVDHTPHQPVPGADPAEGGITMTYTKKARPKEVSTSRRPSKVGINSEHPASSHSSSSGTSPMPSPIVGSSAHYSPNVKDIHPQAESRDTNLLPTDAIDLVVEDREAEEEAMTRNRHKGEPAVRQMAGHKVYRREYVVQESSKEKDTQLEAEEEEGIPNPPKGNEPQGNREQSTGLKPSEGGTVESTKPDLVPASEGIQAFTSPPQIRIDEFSPTFPSFRDEDVESNPWA